MSSNIADVQINNKKYEDFSLNDISFSISAGDIMAVLGPNGNGKTTIIKCILNMTRFEGTINILGSDISGNSEDYKEQLGVILDCFFFDEGLNINTLSKILPHLYKNWDSQSFSDYINRFELPPKKSFVKYSKGMKVKLLLAVALSHHARLLVFDEPTSGLDPIFRFELKNILKEYVKKESASIIFSTHITADVENFANKLMIVKKGKSIIFDDTDTIMNKYDLFKGDISNLKKSGFDENLCYYKNDNYAEMLIEHKNTDKISDEYISAPSLEDIMIALCNGKKN